MFTLATCEPPVPVYGIPQNGYGTPLNNYAGNNNFGTQGNNFEGQNYHEGQDHDHSEVLKKYLYLFKNTLTWYAQLDTKDAINCYFDVLQIKNIIL